MVRGYTCRADEAQEGRNHSSMRNLTVKQALGSGAPKRTRPYSHKAGAFTLTASFRSPQVDWTAIRLVHALNRTFTQQTIADLLGVSVSVVGKMVRVGNAELGGGK